MIRVVNVRELVLVTLSVVSDMSYAWETMGDYTELSTPCRRRYNRYGPLRVVTIVRPVRRTVRQRVQRGAFSSLVGTYHHLFTCWSRRLEPEETT